MAVSSDGVSSSIQAENCNSHADEAHRPYAQELGVLLRGFRGDIEHDMKMCLVGVENKLDELLSRQNVWLPAVTQGPHHAPFGVPPVMNVNPPEKHDLLGKDATNGALLASTSSTRTTTTDYAGRRPSKDSPRYASSSKLLDVPARDIDTVSSTSIEEVGRDYGNAIEEIRRTSLPNVSFKKQSSTLTVLSPAGSLPMREGKSVLKDSNRKHTGGRTEAVRNSVLKAASRLSNDNEGHITEMLWKMYTDPTSSKVARAYHKIMPRFILLTVGAAFLQTPEDPPLRGSAGVVTDTVIDSVFMLDVIARIIVSPSKFGFFLNLHNVVDCATASSLIVRACSGFAPSSQGDRDDDDVALLVLLGLVPVFRLLKVLRYFKQMHLLIEAFRKSFEALPVMLYMYVLLLLTSCGLHYIVEPRSNFRTLPEAMWYSLISVTTVGYGDYVAETTMGKCLTAFFVITVALYMAIPIGIIGTAFSEVWHARDEILLKQKLCECWYLRGFSAKDTIRLWTIFDCDGDGTLSCKELCEMMKQMKMGLTEEEVTTLFDMLDKNSDENISTREFVKAIFPSEYAATLAALLDQRSGDKGKKSVKRIQISDQEAGSKESTHSPPGSVESYADIDPPACEDERPHAMVTDVNAPVDHNENARATTCWHS